MRPRRFAAAAAGVLAAAVVSAQAWAQCRPPAGSHEARLLAFYEGPTAFTMSAAPERLAAGAIRVAAEVIPVPSPDAALQQPDYCYQNARNDTRLAPVFGRPRVTVGLPAGLALEGSWLPGITVSGAEANLAGVALSRSQDLRLARLARTPVTLLLRAHATVGRVRGAITCSQASLQTTDPDAPCYGSRPSRDTFNPNAVGLEGALGASSRGGRVAGYLGAGMSWLRPRFQVGFTDALGNVDRTRVEVDLARATVFGGATLRLHDRLAASTQVYVVPADGTTVRAGVEYRLR